MHSIATVYTNSPHLSSGCTKIGILLVYTLGYIGIMKSEIEIGQRLEQCRNQIKPNKTQSEVAEDLGIGRDHLIKLEKNQRQPSYDLLIRIAKYYNTTTDWLLGKNKDSLPEGATEIIGYLSEMSPRGRAEIVVIAKAIHQLDQQWQAVGTGANMLANVYGPELLDAIEQELLTLSAELGDRSAALKVLIRRLGPEGSGE